MDAAPVADHHAGEAPLLSEDGGLQMIVLRTPAAIDFIIGCHHAPGIAVTDGHFEGTEVDLVHGTVGYPYVDIASGFLLVVEGIVFQTHCRTVVLCALGVCHCQHAAEQGVFAQVFVGSSTGGNTLYIDGWSENHVLATQSCLMAHAPSVGIGPLRAPGGCQRRTRGEEGGGVGGQMGGVP